MRRLAAVLVTILAGLLAACGDDSDDDEAGGTGPTTTTTTAARSTTTAAADEQETVAVAETSLGEVLVDADGRTVYMFARDSGGTSQCRGPCAQTWPPVVASGEPTAGAGLDATKVGTTTRDDGTRQVTYNGHPLYRYAPDQAPGDTEGHGVGGVWFAVTPTGEAVPADAGG